MLTKIDYKNYLNLDGKNVKSISIQEYYNYSSSFEHYRKYNVSSLKKESVSDVLERAVAKKDRHLNEDFDLLCGLLENLKENKVYQIYICYIVYGDCTLPNIFNSIEEAEQYLEEKNLIEKLNK